MKELQQAIKALQDAGYEFDRHTKHAIYINKKTHSRIPLKTHSFTKNDLRYILKEIEKAKKDTQGDKNDIFV